MTLAPSLYSSSGHVLLSLSLAWPLPTLVCALTVNQITSQTQGDSEWHNGGKFALTSEDIRAPNDILRVCRRSSIAYLGNGNWHRNGLNGAVIPKDRPKS